ncbi:15169_t:CDS:2, partial [Racocetra fulgida]
MNCELDIELKKSNSYDSYNSFVEAVTNYAKQQRFQIRLGKIETNSNGDIRKRTILCSREGSPQIILTEVQEKIKLLCYAGCNIPTIHAILKEEFNGVVTWVYNDLYNFVYQQEEVAEKYYLDASESMNNLIKGYMDATTSLSMFLKAFESALDQRKEDLEFLKYRESAISVQLVTKSPVEKQAMQLLTQYTLKKTQIQLLEIISQLNLEEINSELFLLRWRKDPNEYTIAKTYRTFYSVTNIESNQAKNDLLEDDYTEYKYFLNRAYKTFYNSFNKLVQKELTVNTSEQASLSNEIINPISVKQKGRVSQKRIKRELENNNKSKKHKKSKVEDYNQPSIDNQIFEEENQTSSESNKEDLLKVINREVNSYYYNLAVEVCKEVGIRKANTPMPGYYGLRKLNIICDTLIKLFFYSNILISDITCSKNPMYYLQEVLVSETALRLIAQDREGILLEDARKIMED